MKWNISVPAILAAATMLVIGPASLHAQSAAGADAPSTSDAASATTQPADAGSSRTTRAIWTGTVNAFAAALVDPTDSAALRSLLSDDVIVRQFNRAGRQDISHLRERVNGMNVMMSRAYLQTPVALAADIASAVKDVPLPGEIKRRLTPVDDEALKRANATASKWISASLFTNGSEPVAVIALWSEDDVSSPSPATQPADGADGKQDSHNQPHIVMPLFILLKGDLVAPDRMEISQICFGDPLVLTPAAGNGHGGHGGDDRSTASGD
jgi:hypothetical protein